MSNTYKIKILTFLDIKKPQNQRFWGLSCGERGICIPFVMPLFKRVLSSFKMSAPNCAPLNLTQFITCIDNIKYTEF